MSEAEIVQRTVTPRTRTSLAGDLRRLGLRPGAVVIMHSSLSAIGWVAGGAVAVLLALQDVLTQDGTVIVLTHSSDRADPAGWENPPVPRRLDPDHPLADTRLRSDPDADSGDGRDRGDLSQLARRSTKQPPARLVRGLRPVRRSRHARP